MNKAKFMVCLLLASMALAACTKIDNPIYDIPADLDDPQEEVTDQPANARGNAPTVSNNGEGEHTC